jgi:hypothetical protein
MKNGGNKTMKTKLFWLASLSLLATLLISGTVFAEVETPQPPAAEGPPAAEAPLIMEEAVPPAAEAPALEEPPIEAVPVDGTLLEAEEPVLAETPPEAGISAPIAEEPTAMIAEPEIVVIDPAGESLDMASQESAQAIVSADPYFTVGLITYRFSEAMNYCSTNFPGNPYCFDGSTTYTVTHAIQDAIDYMRVYLGTTPNDGNIYVQQAEYVQNVTIDANTYSVLSTLKGLIGLADAGIFPTISGNVTIKNLLTGFTLSGFTINGGVSITNVTGALNLTDLNVSNPSGNGITITGQKGNVTMTRVKSSNNNNYGAYIDNTAAVGNVAITNSAFDDNGNPAVGTGLYIQTNGTVTINGLSASRNHDTGLMVYYFSSLTIDNAVLKSNTSGGVGYGLFAYTAKVAPVVLRNVIASNNKEDGLYIQTAGTISLNSVDTHDNTNSGIFLNNEAGTGTVSLTNIRSGNNTVYGLYVKSRGAITLSSVTAYQNHGQYGAFLDNSGGTGSVTVTSPAAAGYAGANSFWGNDNGYGLYIQSKGAVTVTNLDAYSNFYDGLYIQNDYGIAGITVNKNLSNWYNGFWDNGDQGIDLSTKGIVNLSSCVASENDHEGILIIGAGAITLTDVQAYNNGLAGAYSGLKIINTAGTGGVTIRSTVIANYMDFSGNSWYGIQITTKGAVSISSLKVNDTTGRSGLYIDNRTITTASPAVTISNGEFNNNNRSGVEVYSKGAITLTNVSANDNLNNYPGVLLDNTSGSASGVTIRSSSPSKYYTFNRNSSYGIQISSNGAVAVSNVIAEENINGIEIQNSAAGSNQPVSVSNSWFNSNNQDGLAISCRGAITLTNVAASDNTSGYGATLSNWSGFGATGVTIRSTSATAYYDFNGNGLDGIYIWSNGAVSVGNALANGNGNYGLNIRRYTGVGAISVTRGTFDHNTFGGVQILTTPGVITLTDVTASFNDPTIGGPEYSGVYINSTYAGSGGSVTVKSSLAANRYAFSFNTLHGLEIYAKGPVTVSNVIAEGNQNTNIYISNTHAFPAAAYPVSVIHSTANDSVTGYGIRITTYGSVTLNTLTANHNFYDGLNVYAYDPAIPTPANVTLSGTGSEFSRNSVCGLNIQTEGNIYLMNVVAEGNTGVGIYLTNNYTGSIGNVTINASASFWNSSSGNDDVGLDIQSRGTVSISRLLSNENLDNGIRINNSHANPLAKNVTLTSVEANRNRGSYGLLINSKGIVALNSTSVNSNEHDGIRIITSGAVNFNGVSASFNSTHEADIPAANATVHERLTSDSEGDIWHFVGNNAIPYTITLESTDFDAYLKLFHWNSVSEEWDFVIGDDSSYGAGGGIDDAQLTFPTGAGGLITGDDYYLLATTPWGWGSPGEYSLGFNEPGADYPAPQFLGAFIDNHAVTANVTITSPAAFWSSFSENNYTGLNIFTNGAVSITNTDASKNGYRGMDIYGSSGPTSVTIRNTSTTRLMVIWGNKSYGIYVPNAYGAITLSGRIFANNNGNTGVYLKNSNVLDTAPMSVTVTSLTASGNADAGVYVESKGIVTLSSLTATSNQSTLYGVYIKNDFTPNSSVTINGSNLISDNKGDGLKVATNGVLSITGVRAENNMKRGLSLGAYTAGKNVTLSNIISQYNSDTGVYLEALGMVTLTNVRSYLNGGDGIYVDANDAYHIYLNTCSAIGNEGSGIWANSHLLRLHLSATTSYFGNDTDNSGLPDVDLYYIP